MEFYFSDANLHKDRFLKQQLQQSSDGCEIIFYCRRIYFWLVKKIWYILMPCVIIINCQVNTGSLDKWIKSGVNSGVNARLNT